jgi:hypothetical protein
MSFLSAILENTNGKFFTVEFVKKDGSIRKMNARLGVKKHLRGGECTLDREKFLIVFDMQSNGYRAINRESILSVSCEGALLFNAKAT